MFPICASNSYSQVCVQAKECGVALLVALCAIAVVGSALTVLTMYGYNIGGLNALPSLMGRPAVYVALAGSTLLLTVSIAMVISMVRSYKNKQFTTQELEKLGLFNYISDIDIASQMQPNQQQKITGILPNGQPLLYALLVKDESGITRVYGYKHEADLRAKIKNEGIIQ